MKIKRTKNLLYICSAVMVLGLALLSFDAPGPAKQTVSDATPAPTKAPNNTPSIAPSKTPENTTTPTPVPTSTPTPSPTPTPTPTPSLAQLNAAIEIKPATDDIGSGLTTVITDYLNNFYSNEDLQVNEINNITCYYKEGLAGINYFVYVSYDILYEGSNVPIPTLEEYLVTIEGETVTVHTTSDNSDVQEALLLSRASKSVSDLYIKEMIRCYMNAKLAVDEALLSSIVTDSSYLDFEKIRKTTEYIEEYKNPEYLIYSCSDTVSEFDYVVFVAFESKIINIKTPAPGVDEFIIKMDNNNYPHMFLGNISSESQDYRMKLRMTDEYTTFYKTKAETPLVEAMLSDPSLKDFIERLYLEDEED